MNSSEECVARPHQEGIAGVGGQFNFLFKLENNSNLPKIIFEYFRPFQPNKIADRIVVTINVEN